MLFGVVVIIEDSFNTNKDIYVHVDLNIIIYAMHCVNLSIQDIIKCYDHTIKKM